MRPPSHVSVIGAGPAGLAAAIELARHGTAVAVYEQHEDVGARFHGDAQGLENWSGDEDVLDGLGRLGIVLRCACRPMHEVTLVDARGVVRTVRDERPLLYLVKRGREPDSLDRSLRAQAEALGVRIRFGRRARPHEVPGPVVVATGPRTTQAVVAGIVAETGHPDRVVAIASDRLAPKCYAYCVVWNGRATVATALADRFHDAWRCFRHTRAAFATLGLHDFRRPRRFGGRAHVCFGWPVQQGTGFYVGEAAGLQDHLLGFGLRYALLSGHLAARSLLGGEPYPELLDRHLGDPFRAGFVNRLLYNLAGDRGHAALIRWVAGARRPRSRAHMLYSFTPVHRILWPLARAAARRRGGSLTPITRGTGPRGPRGPEQEREPCGREVSSS